MFVGRAKSKIILYLQDKAWRQTCQSIRQENFPFGDEKNSGVFLSLLRCWRGA